MQIVVNFVKESRGLICKNPSDKGSWVVLDKGWKMKWARMGKDEIVVGIDYYASIVGETKDGHLRFCSIYESVAEFQRKLEEERQVAQRKRELEALPIVNLLVSHKRHKPTIVETTYRDPRGKWVSGGPAYITAEKARVDVLVQVEGSPEWHLVAMVEDLGNSKIEGKKVVIERYFRERATGKTLGEFRETNGKREYTYREIKGSVSK